MSKITNRGANPVLALEVDRTGSVTKKTMKLDQDSQLTNSLLQGLYPGIRVATVDVPTEPLDGCEQAIVEQALTRIEVDGVRYSLVGASGSAKNGKFYAVEASFEKKLGERFRFSPQAAITYFGILVSSCKVLIEEPDCRVMVVDDREFGTNDCRGWISQSLFRKLQQKHQAELLAKETERLLAQRLADCSEDQEDLALSEEEETALVEQAKRRIQGKRIGGASLLSISPGVRQRPRRRARSRSWRMKSLGISKLTSSCPDRASSPSTREACCGRFAHSWGIARHTPSAVRWSLVSAMSPATSNSIRVIPCWSTRRKSPLNSKSNRTLSARSRKCGRPSRRTTSRSYSSCSAPRRVNECWSPAKKPIPTTLRTNTRWRRQH